MLHTYKFVSAKRFFNEKPKREFTITKSLFQNITVSPGGAGTVSITVFTKDEYGKMEFVMLQLTAYHSCMLCYS